MLRKLHIGGHHASPGWQVFDARPAPHVDHVGNALDLSRFADNSFNELYASHVLEHFEYQNDLHTALNEWFRVLVPGGVLRLSVPDIDVLAHLLLQRQSLDVMQRFSVMRMMFGGQMHEHDHHRVGLNQDFMASYLARAGFTPLQRVPSHGLFDDTSETVLAGTPISLNMLAFKPLPVPLPVPLQPPVAPPQTAATTSPLPTQATADWAA